MKFKQFLDFRNFANRKDIRRKCNPIVDLSKFTSNKKILSYKILKKLKISSYVINKLFKLKVFVI